MQNFRINNPMLLAGVALSLAIAAGTAVYHSSEVRAADEAHSQVKPLPVVDVVTLAPQKLRTWTEFSGHLEAVEHVEIRPRVGGAIQQVLFEEGSIVKAGDLLYVIDPRPYEAAVASAEAALASAESQLKLAKIELDRAAGLAKENAVSRSAHDGRRNDYRVALASIKTAEATLKTASLDLEYAHISAPVSGRISRTELTVGNIIEAGTNAPVLTTIVSNDRLYAEFDVDEQTYMKIVRQAGADKSLPVQLQLSGDIGVVYNGNIHSFDNHLDISSGTIRARAIFENTDGALIPGMYAGVRLGSSDAVDTLLINERAVGTDQDKKFVYVVNSESKIAYREVSLGGRAQGKRIVVSGLKAGEQVVVNNIQRVRPDMAVKAINAADKTEASRQAEPLAFLSGSNVDKN